MAPRRLASALFIAASLRQAHGDFRAACRSFAFASMDPLVTPGERSVHQHTIVGSLGFADKIYPKAMAANESTCDVVADHSNYWAPTMYQNINGVKHAMLPRMNAYYTFTAAMAPSLHAEAFAKPFGMVIGSSTGEGFANASINFWYAVGNKVSEAPVKGWPISATNVTWVRIDYLFPQCWNGKSQYMQDMSHVKYADLRTGKCPSTHLNRIPQIRLEVKYEFTKPLSWGKGKMPFSFSCGGENTAHADVLSLWDVPKMQMLIDACPGQEPRCKYPGQTMVGSTERDMIAMDFNVPAIYK